MKLFGFEISRPGDDLAKAANGLPKGKQTSLAELAQVIANAAPVLGPGIPTAPIHPEQRDPRIFSYQPGRNIIQTPRAYEPVTFDMLLGLCDNYDVARIAIEARKEEARGWSWDVRVKPVPGLTRPDQRARAAQFSDQLARVRGFLTTPDQDNSFETWLMMLAEDIFTIDAPTIYLRPTLGGTLYAAEVVDGATIRPLIDQYGRTPRLYTNTIPAPHQHDWVADAVAETRNCSICNWPAAYGQTIRGTTWNYWAAYEMIYEPYHQNTRSPYGSPPIYWVLLAVNRALRRQTADLARFTEGNIPAAFYKVPEGWTPDQIQQLQGILDDLLSGSDAGRSRIRLMPGGNGAGLDPIIPEPKNDVEAWLMHITAAAFGTSAYELGFEPDSGLGGAGFGDASRANAEKRGSKPLSEYLQSLMNRIIAGPLGLPEIEFFWRGLGQTEDQLKEAQRDEIRWKAGAYSADEWREDMGLDPIGMEPTVFDPKIGVVMVSDLLRTAQAVAQVAGTQTEAQLTTGSPTTPVASAVPGALTTAENAEPPLTTKSADDDLRAWRRKAIRALAAGKDPARFNSALIDDDLQQSIRGRLAKAHTAGDVREIFTSEVTKWAD